MRNAVLVLTSLLAVPALADSPAVCIDSELAFDTSALERIVRDPQGVLDDEDAYWRDEPAQEFTTVWAANNGFELDRKEWRRAMSGFAEMDEAARRNGELMRVTDAILASREPFLAEGLPHVCSFLPEGTDTGVPVYFTAFISPRAFVTGGVVINVVADYWGGDDGHILNALIHEIWHVGYSRVRAERTETPHEHEPLYGILDRLQNEGTATYVGYVARSVFPAPGERDYDLLESPDDVDAALAAVRDVLSRFGQDSEQRLRERSWQIGVEDRAYYVAGAHMARMIDGVAGREELLRTVATGPRSFVEAYNAVAPDGRTIDLPDDETIAGRGVSMGFPRVLGSIGLVAGLLAVGILVFVIRKVTV